LARGGKFKVGVKTLDIINPAQLDLKNQTKKDRRLKRAIVKSGVWVIKQHLDPVLLV
jgi:hypothetical protein